MDEQRISELFRDAVRDVPPPSFDRADITTESARLTRKRNTVLAGSALGFAVVAGAVAVSVSLWSGPAPGNDPVAIGPAPTSQGNARAETFESPVGGSGATDGGLDNSTIVPSSSPKQGGTTDGQAGETGSTPRGCDTAAGGLAAALAGELPAATSPGPTALSPLPCPPGATSAAIPVSEGPRKGVLSVMVVPSGGAQQQAPWSDLTPGTTGVVVETGSGGQLVLTMEPVAGSAEPPLDGPMLSTLAGKLAPGF